MMHTSSPHIPISRSVSQVMQQVLIALIPGILISTYYLGIGIIINCILSVLAAVLFEAIVLKLRNQAIKHTLSDYSAIVTGVLLALCLSPDTPWWVTIIGSGFAIVMAKHLFGGLGQNPFNPAMTGYVFVVLCFPLQLELMQMPMVPELETGELYGLSGVTVWQWISIAYLLGGIWLLIKKVIRWHVAVTLLTTLFFLGIISNFIDSVQFPSGLFHLFTGGTMLCAFFIATDPSSSASTPVGKYLYAAGVAIFIFIIRSWGSYPDGIAFAILIMNGLAPMIDHYTQPRVLGKH